MDSIHVRIKAHIFRSGATQEQVAAAIGISPSLFSLILRSVRPMPPDFEVQVMKALNLLEKAEKAAAEAREQVLAGFDEEEAKSA